jgi:hypothetical protein
VTPQASAARPKCRSGQGERKSSLSINVLAAFTARRDTFMIDR